MDARTRVEAALALEVADRPPVGLWGHDYLAEWDPRDLARSTIEGQIRHGWDFVKFQPRASCFAEAFGARYKSSGDRLERPTMVVPAVEGETWEALTPPEMKSGPLADQIDSLRMVVDSLGSRVPVIQTVFSPLMVAGYLIGDSRKAMVEELRNRPHLVLRAMNTIADALVDFSIRSIASGAAGIFFAVADYASREVLSPSEYSEMVLPYDRKVLEAVAQRSRPWFTVLHLCGSNVMYELFQTLPFDALSWSIHDRGNPALADVVNETGNAAMGGIAQATTLVAGSARQASAEARAAAQQNEGRGILVSPGCSVPPQAKEESIRAVAGAL